MLTESPQWRVFLSFVYFWEMAVSIVLLWKDDSCSGRGPTSFALFTPSTPVCDHLHTRKPAKVNLAHHQLLLPWEPKQRSPSPSRTQRLSHTFWHVYTPNRAGQELLRKTLVSSLPSSLSCHTHMHANMLACFSSFLFHPTETQDRLCVNTLCMWQVCRCTIRVCNFVSVQSVSVLRSGHWCVVCHTPVHNLHHCYDVTARVWGH